MVTSKAPRLYRYCESGTHVRMGDNRIMCIYNGGHPISDFCIQKGDLDLGEGVGEGGVG